MLFDGGCGIVFVAVALVFARAAEASAAAAAAAAAAAGFSVNSTVSSESSSSSWMLSAADLLWPLAKRVGDRVFEAKQQMPPSTEFEIWSLIWLFVLAGGVALTGVACIKSRETLYRGKLEASLEDKED